MTILEWKNYSCFYPVKKEMIQVLDTFSFAVKRGETIVITGPSGSGKTTLLRSLLGLVKYYQGEILINNQPLEQRKGTNDLFGYVNQEYTLYPHLTIYENLAFPLRLMHTRQEEVDRRVKEIANTLQISYLLSRKPKQLSGGQQALVALGRAMIRKPDVLLLDEPFANLDLTRRMEMKSLLLKVKEEYQYTILYVSHNQEDIFFLADKMIELSSGKIAKMMTVEKLKEEQQVELYEK